MAYARKNYRGTRRNGSGGRSVARRGTGTRRRVSSSRSTGRAVRIELVIPGMSASRPFEVPAGASKRSKF